VLAEVAALELRRLSWKRVWAALKAINAVFHDNDLLSYGSSIAFQILYAVSPLVLVALAGLGVVGQRSLYARHIAPHLRRDMSHDAFRIVDTTARNVMTHKAGFWFSIGFLVILWGVSSAIRAMSQPLNLIVGAEEDRPLWERMLTSFGVALIVIVGVYGAVLAVWAGRLVPTPSWWLAVLVFCGRWGLAVGLLLGVGAALIRFVPAKKLPAAWVSVGSVLAAGSWIGATLVFTAYVSLVSYTSLYGFFAIVVVLLAYLYYGSVSFLFGVVVDAQLRELVKRRERARRAS
jgi:YihY family inner membrane protein